jgi:hypothetical protein
MPEKRLVFASPTETPLRKAMTQSGAKQATHILDLGTIDHIRRELCAEAAERRLRELEDLLSGLALSSK